MNAPWSDGERPPSGLRHIWGRFAIAAVLIIAIAGGATAVATLNKASTIAHNLFPVTHEIHTRKGVVTAAVYSGRPETFLLIGSDRRARSKNVSEREAAHSDTMMLVHLDPKQGQISVLSIPRDLLVHIRTRGGQVYYPEKINAAYTFGSQEKGAGGGAALVAETIERLFEHATGHPFKLAGLVDVSFKGFIRVVDSLGCVYVNVDHRYYNRNIGTPETDYSNINLHPGYHRLCYEKALSYVRYRHTDSDFVRVARQQDFIRSLREQIKLGKVVGQIEHVSKSVGKAILSTFKPSQTELIELGKLVAFSEEKPLREIRFETADDSYMLRNANGEEGDYVTTTPQMIRSTLEKFLHSQRHAKLPSAASKAAKGGASSPHRKGGAQGRGAHGHRRPRHRGLTPAQLHLEPTAQPDEVLSMAPGLPFPLKYPRLKTDQAIPMEVETYGLKNRAGKRYKAFVEVFQESSQGGYYDVEGMNWQDPPIVARPNAHRRMDGRRYSIYEDGEHVHVIAWREHGGLYWVNNTLLDELTPDQMFAIANSVRDPH